jgi:pimeloyl-ACP methyl ester carboxylesterase
MCYIVTKKKLNVLYKQQRHTKMSKANMDQKQMHFVLVHGSGMGAWNWYKLKPRLESSGHKVTTLDLAASGINTQEIQDVDTFAEYSKPLLDFMISLGPNEKVVLVGHSFGGMSIALAMENFPRKILVGIFLAAFIPDTHHKPSYVLQLVRIYYGQLIYTYILQYKCHLFCPNL